MTMLAPTQPLSEISFDNDFDLSYQDLRIEEVAASPSRPRGVNLLGGQAKTQHQDATASPAVPEWFIELETALTTSNWDQAQQLSAMRQALEALAKMGNGLNNLVKEGQELIKKLQGTEIEGRGVQQRLVRWLERLRKRLESPLETTQRRSWWR